MTTAIDTTAPPPDTAVEVRRGDPADLWDELRARAYHACGDWARLTLESGLSLGMRIREKDMRKEIYAGRADRPADWPAEVQQLLPHLFRAGWYREELERPSGTYMRFVSLYVGERAPGVR